MTRGLVSLVYRVYDHCHEVTANRSIAVVIRAIHARPASFDLFLVWRITGGRWQGESS